LWLIATFGPTREDWEKKTLCNVVFSFEFGQTSFFHNFIVDLRIEKLWYHFFLHKIFKFLFPKNRKIT